jgi:hypothetical protein
MDPNPYESPDTDEKAKSEPISRFSGHPALVPILVVAWVAFSISVLDAMTVEIDAMRFCIPRWLCVLIGLVPLACFLASIPVLCVRRGNESRNSLVHAIGQVSLPVRVFASLALFVALTLIIHFLRTFVVR